MACDVLTIAGFWLLLPALGKCGNLCHSSEVFSVINKSKAYSRMSRPAPARCQFRYAVSSYVHGTCPCIYGIGKVGEQAEDMHNMVYALRDSDFSAGTVD